jgi:hypothetical protein
MNNSSKLVAVVVGGLAIVYLIHAIPLWTATQSPLQKCNAPARAHVVEKLNQPGNEVAVDVVVVDQYDAAIDKALCRMRYHRPNGDIGLDILLRPPREVAYTVQPDGDGDLDVGLPAILGLTK